MCIFGIYIRETGNVDCMRDLIAIFKNTNEGNLIRNVAYDAIARGVGTESAELRKWDYNDDISKSYIEK